MHKVQLTWDEYDKMVELAHHVNEVADDIYERDQKKKFLMRSCPPTVQQLLDHHVEENFEKYLPLLIYFYEPELYKGEHTPEYKELHTYLAKLFATHLELVDE